MRDDIYKCLFSSTRLTFGERTTGRISRKTMLSAPHALAILRVCRQVHDEIEALWLGLILFSFEHVEAMLDEFSPLSPNVLSRIRHVRTSGQTLMLSFEGRYRDSYLRLGSVLKLLPDLRLDRLTVLASPGSEVAYETLGGLIEHGSGWRELRFVTQDSEMLGFAVSDKEDPYLRKPQPGFWNEIIVQRDGRQSGASVTIYRSTKLNTPCSVLCPQTRQTFQQTPAGVEVIEKFGLVEDGVIMRDSEKGKELLVVVKRGRGGDLSTQTRPPFHVEDIRQWVGNISWAEIRRRHLDIYDSDEDDCDNFLATVSDEETGYIGDSDDDPIRDGRNGRDCFSWARNPEREVDRYHDIDDYEWPVHTGW